MPKSVASLIDEIGGITAVAQHFDIPVSTVGSWKARNSIPDERRPGIIALAEAKGIPGVTYESLTMIIIAPEAPEPQQAAE